MNKKQTLSSIAKAVVSEGGDQLAVREAQLDFLKSRKNTAGNRLNVEAWTRMVAYLKANA